MNENVHQKMDARPQAEQAAVEAKRQESVKIAEIQSRDRVEQDKGHRETLALLGKHMQTGVDLHKAEAEIALVMAQVEKVQAETLAALDKAGEQASAKTREDAVMKEGESRSANADLIKGLSDAFRSINVPKRAKISRQADGSLLGEIAPIEAPAPDTVQ